MLYIKVCREKRGERESPTPPRGSLPGFGDCLRDVRDGLGRGKTGHDNRRVAHDLTDVGSDGDARKSKLGSSCGVDIEADPPPSTIDEIAGDCPSHDPKPDDANDLVHEKLPPNLAASCIL